MTQGDRQFDLQSYIKNLAWKAFLRAKDPAIDVDDFLQEAQIALIEATRNFDPEYGAKLNTYVVCRVINRLKNMPQQDRPMADPSRKHSVTPDDFWLRVDEVLSSKGNRRAKRLLNTLLHKYADLKRCSVNELRRVSGFTDKDFNLARLQLSRY
jgi:DNA-directed RNA polymerase specialized sigma24 family protein